MTAYLIVRVAIRDREAYARYAALAPAIVARFGGEYLARGGASECLEGEPFTGRIVVVKFPSMAQARAWYASPEYQAAKAVRDSAGDAEFTIVEGLA